MVRGRFINLSRRRIAVVLPLLLVATLAPIVRPASNPRLRHRVLEVTQRVLKAPDPFSLVGLQVDSQPTAPVRIRASRDGERWSRWETFEFEREVGPDPGSRESGASTSMPVWTGPNRYVEVSGAPRGSKVHTIDPGPDPAPPTRAAMASPSKPGIITRSQWGADESIRRADPSYASSLELSVIHHTATTDSYASSESDNIVRSIYAYHVNTNGWDDIGYNFLIDRYGRVFEGRYGGVDRNVIGAHSQGFNTGSTGIAIIGNFAGSKPPEVAMQAMKRLVSWRMDQATPDPGGSVTYTSHGSNRFPKGTKVRLRRVIGHRDVGHTACPGNPLQGALPWLRLAAKKDGLPKLFNAVRSRGGITPNGDGVADAVRLAGQFSSPMNWKLSVVDVSGRSAYSISGSGSTLSFTWNGKNSSGSLVPHAPYRFRVSGSGAAGRLRNYEMPIQVYRWPEGTYFHTTSKVNYFLLKGQLRRPSNWQARATWFTSAELVKVSDAITRYYPVGRHIGFRPGSLVKADGKIYLISAGIRRPTSTSALRARGFSTRGIIETTSGALAPHAVGSAFGSSSPYPDGTALRNTAGSEAWMRGGLARPFVSAKARASHMIRSVDIAGPADAELAAGATSGRLGFRDGSLVRVTGTSTIYMISGGRRLPFRSLTTFKRMRFRESNIRDVSAAELSVHPQGETL